MNTPTPYWFPLFDHMAREHGLTLTDSQLHEIALAAERCTQQPKPAIPTIQTMNNTNPTLSVFHHPKGDLLLISNDSASHTFTRDDALSILAQLPAAIAKMACPLQSPPEHTAISTLDKCENQVAHETLQQNPRVHLP